MQHKVESLKALMLANVAVYLSCLLLSTTSLQGQAPPASPTAGQKAVCSSTLTCSTQVQSSAVIDASAVSTTGFSTTICGRIGAALKTLHGLLSAGGVVDARGISTSLSCGSSETPWTGVSPIPPATILLPATTPGSPIVIGTPWVLPNQTRLIGVGTGISCQNSTPCAATIFTTPSGANNMTMLTMGSSTFCPSTGCTGITIENLTLAPPSNATVGGILNQNAGQGSYVSHVGMNGVLVTGLLISSSLAQNSGPYSDISFTVAGGATSTTCVQILNVGGTKGIHRLTCLSSDTAEQSAIKLDSSSNSIEDVQIGGFADGILIGNAGIAQGNSIINVTDVTPPTQDDATVHISGANTVTDLTIMGINNSCSGMGCHSYTLADEVGQIRLPANTDPNLGMYVLGSNNFGAPFARFTTSPSAPTWAVGSGSPSPSFPCYPGSLYSNTTGSGGSLWVCKVGTSPSWQLEK